MKFLKCAEIFFNKFTIFHLLKIPNPFIMKKILFWSLFLLLPAALLAQNSQTLVKDFEKKVQRLENSFKISDHVGVVQITVDDDNFELVAIDDKMQILWRISLTGQGANSGVFKGNILATASIPGKSKNDPIDYIAYLVDAQTGKLLIQKHIYQSTSDNFETTETLFAKDGSWARYLIRQTAATKKGRFMTVDDYDATKQFTVFDLGDKLELTQTQYNLPAGVYVGMVSGSAENFAVLIFERGKAFKAFKFTDGKTEAVDSIEQDLDLPEKLFSPAKFSAKCIVSTTDPNVAYLSSYFKGSDN